MKNIKYILILLLAVSLFSCDDEDIVQLDETMYTPATNIEGFGETLAISNDTKDESVEIHYLPASYGVNIVVTHKLQFSITDDFADPAIFASEASDNKFTFTKGSLNEALIQQLKLPVDEEVTLYARVITTPLDGVETLYSSAISFKTTPYETVIIYPMIYVPGAYQGWTPGAENGVLYSYDFNTVYEGVIRISSADAATEFKITPEANWDNAWGGSLTADGDNYSGTLDGAGGNFSVTNATYTFTVNTDALTITMVKTDDWGIIGSSIPPYDWSEDVDMFYNGQTKMWEITTDLVAGEFKFRKNDDWGGDFGDAEGANIGIPADGNYTITMETENNTYTVTANE